MHRRLTTGEFGWIGLAFYVVLVDSIAWRRQAKQKQDETMSVAFGRWLQHPRSRIVTGACWLLVTSHLFVSTPLPGGKTVKKFVTWR